MQAILTSRQGPILTVRRTRILWKVWATGLALLGLAACDGQSGKLSVSDTASSAAGQANEGAASAEISAELANGNFNQAAVMAHAATQSAAASPELFLLLARAEARLNNAGSAIDALEQCFQRGFHDPRGAINHPDFDVIRAGPAFKSLTVRWKIAAGASEADLAEGDAPGSVTRAGDVSIVENNGRTRIRAGDIVIEE